MLEGRMLHPETEFETESTIRARFDRCKSLIVGGLLNRLSHALANLTSTEVPPVRLADFGQFALASLDKDRRPTLLMALQANDLAASGAVLEGDAYAVAVLALLDREGEFVGTAMELVCKLIKLGLKPTGCAGDWPNNPITASNRLQRLSQEFAKQGILFERLARKGGARPFSLRRVPPKTSQSSSSSPENPDQVQENETMPPRVVTTHDDRSPSRHTSGNHADQVLEAIAGSLEQDDDDHDDSDDMGMNRRC